MRVVECMSCGLAFLNPRPFDALLPTLYDPSYFECGGVAGIGYAAREVTGLWARTATDRLMHERLRLISEHSPLRDRTLLDVGCAEGDFASLATREGADAIGIDISSAILEKARQRHPGIEFTQATAGDLADQGRKFDVVSSFEVIEHVTSPRAFLRTLLRLLSPTGIIVLSTPNYGHARTVGVGNWLGFHRSFEHLYFISPETLTGLADAAGLRIEQWYGMGNGAVSDRPAVRIHLSRFLDRVGVLDIARLIRLLLSPAQRYQPVTNGHSLLAILRSK
jgi:2-polyprenyl-3-methyl-5-hydroxy-6-metoxy-1,4-benzoquinol methylase